MNYGPSLEVRHEGPITVVELLNEEILEEGIINSIADSLFSVLADNPGLNLLVSFAKVRHLSSSALGILIRLNKRMQESGGVLKLCELQKSLHEIFVITKLNRLFEIYDSEETAISAFEA